MLSSEDLRLNRELEQTDRFIEFALRKVRQSLVHELIKKRWTLWSVQEVGAYSITAHGDLLTGTSILWVAVTASNSVEQVMMGHSRLIHDLIDAIIHYDFSASRCLLALLKDKAVYVAPSVLFTRMDPPVLRCESSFLNATPRWVRTIGVLTTHARDCVCTICVSHCLCFWHSLKWSFFVYFACLLAKTIYF